MARETSPVPNQAAIIRHMPSPEPESSGGRARDTPNKPSNALETSDESLGAAYEQRTIQLHEARSALADAVAAIRLELDDRRNESAGLREDNRSLREDNRLLRQDAEALRERAIGLEAELQATDELLATVRNMKVVRWTAWPRQIVYRLRDRHR